MRPLVSGAPAAGYALLLRYLASEERQLPVFFIGFVLAAYLKMDVIGIVILAVSVAAMMFADRSSKEGA